MSLSLVLSSASRGEGLAALLIQSMSLSILWKLRTALFSSLGVHRCRSRAMKDTLCQTLKTASACFLVMITLNENIREYSRLWPSFPPLAKEVSRAGEYGYCKNLEMMTRWFEYLSACHFLLSPGNVLCHLEVALVSSHSLSPEDQSEYRMERWNHEEEREEERQLVDSCAIFS